MAPGLSKISQAINMDKEYNSIMKMQNNVLAMMANFYDVNKHNSYTFNENKNVDDPKLIEIENKGFMCAAHAQHALQWCITNKYIVSFRNSGPATLKRIKAGNPCKGHDIETKTVKEKDKQWTYSILGDSNITLEQLEGLVGYPDPQNVSTPKSLGGLWGINDTNIKKQTPLNEVDTAELNLYFTGDYDMHDIINAKNLQNIHRVLSGNDPSIIDGLNNAMLTYPYNAGNKIESDHKRLESIKKFDRTFKSPYALLRHGPQTSFMSFLLNYLSIKELKEQVEKIEEQRNAGEVEILPLENAIMNIDPNIVVLDGQLGKAYILKNAGMIYQYYKSKGDRVLKQIPFYFFFKDLKQRAVGNNEKILNEYTKQLNDHLIKTVSQSKENNYNI